MPASVPDMKLMYIRRVTLHDVIDGYDKTGVDFIAMRTDTDGTSRLYPVGSDDLGLYYIVPKVAAWLGLNTDEGFSVIFMVMLTAALLVSIGVCWVYMRSLAMKILATVELLALSVVIYKAGDVYVFLAVLPMLVLPLVLLMIERQLSLRTWAIVIVVIGLLIGMAHTIRTHSGTAATLFLFIMLFFATKFSWREKVMLLVFFGMMWFVPNLFFKYKLTQRDEFLKQTVQNYNPDDALNRHHFWHPVYLGLGFLYNVHGIIYNDSFAIKKVDTLAPGTTLEMPLYEELLKAEVIYLFKTNTLFVCKTYAAKLGVLAFYFLVAANLGAWGIWRTVEWNTRHLAFLAALGFSSLFGIIAVPNVPYMVGLFAVSTLYGLFSLEEGLRAGKIKFPTRG
jgi:hypothetical protein